MSGFKPGDRVKVEYEATFEAASLAEAQRVIVADDGELRHVVRIADCSLVRRPVAVGDTIDSGTCAAQQLRELLADAVVVDSAGRAWVRGMGTYWHDRDGVPETTDGVSEFAPLLVLHVGGSFPGQPVTKEQQ